MARTGLFDRLAQMITMAHLLPRPLLNYGGAALVKLRLLPDDMLKAAGALWEPRVREASLDFVEMLGDWILEAKRAPKQGKKVFLVPFNFPVEVLHPFEKAVPLTSEVLTTLGVAVLEGQGEAYWDLAMGLGLPDHICSANTIEIGSILSGEDFKPDAIISAAPGGCDVNSKIHEFLSHYLEVPQFFLQKPTDDTGRGRRQYGVYMRTLIANLEQFLGEELTEAKLRPVMEKANRCTELYYELFDLHKAKPSPVPNLFSLFIYGTRFSMWGTDQGVKTMETMVRMAKERLKKQEYPSEQEVARCVWAYTSYYYDFMGFFNWMEERGYSHLGDGLDLFFPKMVDTTNLDTMIDGLAEAAWNMPMTRQVGAESMSKAWTEDVIWAARELNADCAIFCGHHSCKQTWSVVSILRQELEDRLGIPLLVLQGDSWIKNMTPMSSLQEQVDEFVKNALANKGQKKRRVRRRARPEGGTPRQGPL